MVIYLLSCVRQKQPVPAPAKDLYTSSWFRKARCYVENTGQPWFVLSAKYGLVHPDEVIAPYDCTLNAMPVAERRRWASRVLKQLEPHLDGVKCVVFLAGKRYREFLELPLRHQGLDVRVPMEGLRIGEQSQWLTCRRDGPRDPRCLVSERFADTVRFYELLDRLAERVGGPRLLQSCRAEMGWPLRGVYFFYEDGECRSAPGAGLRVVRIGTHALKAGAKNTLWGRLRQHRGPRSGLGNHRGSIFRLLVGEALANRSNIPLPKSWGVAGGAGEAARRLNVDRKTVKESEANIEALVSEYVGQMPFLWLNVDDAPGPNANRGLIERNAIALLSGYSSPAADGPSTAWLGQHSNRERVRLSGLWNNNHVDKTYDPAFLDEMESWIDDTHQ